MESMDALSPVARATLFHRLAARRLNWLPDLGVGFYDVEHPYAPYDARYFAKYLGYRDTDLGRKLTEARVDLVARHWDGPLVDVGIGCGAFVDARPNTLGYDVNPVGVQWLEERGLYRDPYREPVEAVSLWDVLEHIPDFDRLLACVGARVFVSMPVFGGPCEVLASRHFRKDEHCWYFTSFGFLSVMRSLGWELLESNEIETRLGREGIASFAFARLA
jgi:Methyltransferase domain